MHQVNELCMLLIGKVTDKWQHLAAELALPEFNQVALAQLEAIGFLQICCQKVLLTMGNILAVLSAPAFVDGSGPVMLMLPLLQWYAQAGPPAIKRAIVDSPNDTASAFCHLLAGLGDHSNIYNLHLSCLLAVFAMTWGGTCTRRHIDAWNQTSEELEDTSIDKGIVAMPPPKPK